MIWLLFMVVLLLVWIMFRPAIEVTREKDLLLFYDTYRGRDYVRLFKL